ncbi:hypothetical protein O4H61_16970 [Roseovarius aestuarii]|nr:hypothetical protein [Roseovarius aestuarii]
MLETLNWSTIKTPATAGFAAFHRRSERGAGAIAPAIVGVLAFVGLVAVWYALYQAIQFPF